MRISLRYILGRNLPLRATVNQILYKRALQTSSVSYYPRRPPSISYVQEAPSKFGSYDLILPSSSATSSKRPDIPPHVPRPEYCKSGNPEIITNPTIKSAHDITHMNKACQLAAKILEYGRTFAKVGVTTDEIDSKLYDAIIAADAYPSPLNYLGYPNSLCTSINNVVAHGIPNARPLKDGDIVNIDVTVYIDGYHGDTSATFLVGNVDAEGQSLVDTTRQALDLGISICRPGVPFAAIGAVIQDFAKKHSYTVNQEFCGHGIGHYFHEPPLIYHFKNTEPGIMREGMTFTIEPMLNQGNARMMKWRDGWTAVTVDGGRSAQFEHTILITGNGAEILTHV